jgi:hypothetical protein
MVNEKLIAFILKARQNKRTDDQIAQQLLSVGWKQDAVGEAFAEIKAKNLTAQQQPKQPAPQAAAKPQQPTQPAQQPAPQQQLPTQPQPLSQQPAATPPIQQPTVALPQQPSITPQKQQPIALPAIQPPAQTAAPIQLPAQMAQPIPPAKQIDLQQPQKKSFLSSLFGKKPAQPAQAAPQQPSQSQPQTMPQPPAQKAQITPPSIQQQPAPSPPGQPASILQQLPAKAQPPSQAAAQQPPPQTTPPTDAQQPAKPPSGIRTFLPIIAIVVLLAAVGAAYYFFVLAPASALEQQMQPPQAGEQQNAAPQNKTQMAAGPLDCQTDLGCLAEASKECKPSKATTSTTEEFMGALVTSTSYLEIKGEEAGKCMLYVRAEDESVKLGDSLVVAALAKGTSMEEIRNQEAEATKQAKLAVGLGGTCAFNTASLTSMLNRWKAGAHSTNDYAGADCNGAIFEEASFSPSATASLLINKTSGTQTTTKPNATQAPNAAGTPAANATNATKTSTTVATNATKANTTSTTPKTNTTTAPKTNVTNTTNATKTYAFSRRFNSYFPERLVWFCTDRNMEFYRMHWQEYFGGGCSVAKPKEGYVAYDEYIATNCTILPCCINGPYNEYSRSYDYFECGYEEYISNTGLEVKYTNRITLPANSS